MAPGEGAGNGGRPPPPRAHAVPGRTQPHPHAAASVKRCPSTVAPRKHLAHCLPARHGVCKGKSRGVGSGERDVGSRCAVPRPAGRCAFRRHVVSLLWTGHSAQRTLRGEGSVCRRHGWYSAHLCPVLHRWALCRLSAVPPWTRRRAGDADCDHERTRGERARPTHGLPRKPQRVVTGPRQRKRQLTSAVRGSTCISLVAP